MKEWIITEFEKQNYTIKDEYNLENDGIGHYEFWGAPCFDAGTEYITGEVSLYITGEDSIENIENFIDLYDSEIKKVLLNEVQYDNFNHQEEIDYSVKDGIIEIFIEYEASPDRR